MNKFSVLSILRKNGDSVITLRNGEEHCCTTDFSTKYIRSKHRQKFSKERNILLVFSWTINKFLNVNSQEVKEILPLSKILRNKSG